MTWQGLSNASLCSQLKVATVSNIICTQKKKPHTHTTIMETLTSLNLSSKTQTVSSFLTKPSRQINDIYEHKQKLKQNPNQIVLKLRALYNPLLEELIFTEAKTLRRSESVRGGLTQPWVKRR